MDKCPSCGADSMFVLFGPWIDFGGDPHYGRRVEAFCNTIDCEQRFWWHPISHEVTRRNTGQTYAQYRANRLSTCRRPHAAEVAATIGAPGPERPVVESGWRETALGWVYWLRSSILLALPGGKEQES